jgi:uncharacterized damage-inducible protein DinB
MGMPMNEIATIKDQLRRAFEGDAWHGPSLWEIIAGVSAREAAAKPLPGIHSIWEIVLHITAWHEVVCRRLAGEMIVELAPDQNWPAITDTSEAAWQQTLHDLGQSRQHLMQAISRLSEDRLGEAVGGKGYTIYVMLHGVIQHDLYHAGQIAILKKVQSQ